AHHVGYNTVKTEVFILWCDYVTGSHLLSATFGTKILERGFLTVVPAQEFILGSDLTVYCHLTEKCSSSIHLILWLDKVTVEPEQRINCTTARFRLTNLRTPEPVVKCLMRMEGRSYAVTGLRLHGGLPPDKPTDVYCETSRDSGVLDCRWDQGQKTYLSTSYNISLNSVVYTEWLGFFGIANCQVPKTLLDENENYQLTITSYNTKGTSKSEPFNFCVKDVVLPVTPLIVQIKFGNDSSASLRCNSTESSELIHYLARLRTGNGSIWLLAEEERSGTGQLRVEGLNALCEYEFQARACYSAHAGGLTSVPTSASRSRPRCSKWSEPVRRSSPGKGNNHPTYRSHVPHTNHKWQTPWHVLLNDRDESVKCVLFPLQPSPQEDYSGTLRRYEVRAASKTDICLPDLSLCVVQVSPDVHTLWVSAVTSYGRSPPAAVQLIPSGVPGPALKRTLRDGHGSVVLSWSWPPPGPGGSGGTGELVSYVTEWTIRPAELRWNILSRDQNTTLIGGLFAGERYNVSVYAVTTKGISKPSSLLVYSEEKRPLSGPKVSVVDHKAGRVLIQWEELPVACQRGFITSYTIYVRTLSSSLGEHNSNVSVSVSVTPRRVWLDCPEDSVILGLSASNSAGEGPKGEGATCKPSVTHPIVAALIFICWSSVRKRIKQSCISWGPSWLVENVPKPEDSKANALLKYVETSVRPSRPNSHSDPPLSPIEEIPWEDTLLLPTRPWPVQAPGSWPGLTAETERPLPAEGPVESVSYKPHAPCIEEDKEEAGHGGVCGEQGDVPDTPAQERGSGCSLTLNGFPKLSSLYGADGDVPNMRSLGFTEGSGSRLSGLLCSGVFFGGAETEGQGTMCAGYSTGGEGDPWRT
uniref:Fibronectin type-III domain-containing protein n=1 Tax=Gadus morhua TaxID=8049 RepID=A0A8C5F5U8_GADMO